MNDDTRNFGFSLGPDDALNGLHNRQQQKIKKREKLLRAAYVVRWSALSPGTKKNFPFCLVNYTGAALEY